MIGDMIHPRFCVGSSGEMCSDVFRDRNIIISYGSLPYRSVLSIQAWCILVLRVTFLFSHACYVKRDMTADALPILLSSSRWSDRLPHKAEAR